MTHSKKVLLVILDGWGISKNPDYSAIDKAKTPFIDSLNKTYPSAKLKTHGKSVGLPENQMGNSEVGHMNIGAGRIVSQELEKINNSIKNKTFENQPVLQNCLDSVKLSGKNLHLIGLLSDGGVHSHISHLESIIDICVKKSIENVFIHCFTDGRDVDPKSGIEFLKKINEKINSSKYVLASVIGRYFAMDRDNRWERIKKTYDLLVKGYGEKSNNIIKSVQDSYDLGITDEFINPIILVDNNNYPKATIKDGDSVIFFNFRTDRGRQLTEALTQKDFTNLEMKKLSIELITMTEYDNSFNGVKSIYDSKNIEETLGQVISTNNRSQLRIAETEKYPHVTFFFNGGKESPFKNEQRILCPSPKVPTYDLKPEMSAIEIKNSVLKELEKKHSDFICLNFANPDMVGHTGNMEAAIKACETVDLCCKEIVKSGNKNNYSTIIIADHGNCDIMKNLDGTPNTAHTKNLVPIIIVDNDIKEVKNGILADVAPTILKLMNLKKPKLMTGKSLID